MRRRRFYTEISSLATEHHSQMTELLNVARRHPLIQGEDGLWEGAARMELTLDQEADRKALAANVNLLRRHAPYAFLFITGWKLAAWDESVRGPGSEELLAFPARQLRCGVWCYPELRRGMTPTIVMALGTGDALPVVHLLDEEEFALVCLPQPLSLEEIERVICAASSKEELAQKLLGSSGFVLQCIDDVRLSIRTRNPQILEYFRAETESARDESDC